jgi:NAD(P)-dependent dehydrogenase (short-subunit alcohol dehydrogenase family)
MSYQKVALVLGAGPNVGLHVSRAFAAKGYKVALASRSAKSEENTPDLVHFQADLSNPSSVPELFTKVKESLGTPSIVIYNGEYNP